MQRTSNVSQIKILAVTQASIVQIGDNHHIQANTRVLAVQREAEQFYDNEGNLDAYSIFKRRIPEYHTICNVKMRRVHENPMIEVGSIAILGLSSSAVFQVGMNKTIEAEARVKHIRQLLSRSDRKQ